MSAFPTPPNCLPALEPLLNGTLWADWAASGRVFPLDDFRRAVRYVRLKPTTSCRIVLFGDVPDDRETPPPGFLLHLYPDRERATQAFEKLMSRDYLTDVEDEPDRYPAFLSERHAVVAVPYPNDPELRALRHVHHPYRLGQALASILDEFPRDLWHVSKSRTRLTLLAWKPGRRAVYRVDVVLRHRGSRENVRLALHVKVENEATREQSYSKLGAIHGAVPPAAGWRVPRPRGVVRERSLVATEWIDGTPLTDRSGRPVKTLEAYRQAGRALAGLHALDLDLAAHAGRESGLTDLSGDLAELLPGDKSIPGIGRRLSQAAMRLEAGRPATLHGDFHLGQVLLCRGEPALVDLDRAGRGPAELDIGAFRSHLLELGAGPETDAAFLEGYADRSGARPEPLLVELATAAALFRRAVFPFRRLNTDWPERTRRIVRQVEEVLARIDA